MHAAAKSDTVRFTTKGQVVIPARLRKQFHIEAGTRAIVLATPDGILLKPVTAAMIERGFGLLQRKSCGKPLAEEWADYKAEEKALEKSSRRAGRSRAGLAKQPFASGQIEDYHQGGKGD